MQMACFYAQDGRCIGTHTIVRLITLRQLHDNDNTNNQSTTYTSSAAEAADLIRWHRPRKDDPCRWRVPKNVRHVIARHFKITSERFTPPLTVTTNQRKGLGRAPGNALEAGLGTLHTSGHQWRQGLQEQDQTLGSALEAQATQQSSGHDIGGVKGRA